MMRVEIPDELAKELAETAQAIGSQPERVAVAAIRRGLEARERLEALLLPVRTAFEASGLSEDEAVEVFEAEKHALRHERRESPA
jgi:predicted transcriptional regulator